MIIAKCSIFIDYFQCAAFTHSLDVLGEAFHSACTYTSPTSRVAILPITRRSAIVTDFPNWPEAALCDYPPQVLSSLAHPVVLRTFSLTPPGATSASSSISALYSPSSTPLCVSFLTVPIMSFLDGMMEPSEDKIPTYEESIADLSRIPSPFPSIDEKQSNYHRTASPSIRPTPQPPQTLVSQLSNTRTNRITTIINTHILPSFSSQAQNGLHKTTLVLVPFNGSALASQADSDGHEEIVGFPEAEHVKLVRLKGEGYEMEFWRQAEVIKELEGSLKASLQASGHRVVERAKKAAPLPAAPAAPQPESPKPKKGGFFRRSSKKQEEVVEHLAPPLSSPGSMFKTVIPDEPLSDGEVRVRVGVSEVVVRTVSGMGLYETKAGKAVLVRLEIGG